MVIVVDTNVFVGACLGMGASSAVVGDCIRGVHTALMVTTLLTEYEDVLGRDTPFRKSRLAACRTWAIVARESGIEDRSVIV